MSQQDLQQTTTTVKPFFVLKQLFAFSLSGRVLSAQSELHYWLWLVQCVPSPLGKQPPHRGTQTPQTPTGGPVGNGTHVIQHVLTPLTVTHYRLAIWRGGFAYRIREPSGIRM